MDKKVFGYVRVSGKGQVNGDGFTRQTKAINDYAKANGLEVIQIYKEEGVSGTLAKRPGLANMIFDLESNGHGVKTVVIERMDRLARDLMIQEAICAELAKNDIELISSCEGADMISNEPSRKLIRRILGALAEYHSEMNCLKMRAAKERIRSQGYKCEGRKGYVNDHTATLKAIKNLHRKPRKGKRMSLVAIAKQMNQDGFTTSTGKEFNAQVISNILHNAKKPKSYKIAE